MTARATPKSTSQTRRTYDREMARIEGLSRRLLELKIRSGADLWKLERDIIAYQVSTLRNLYKARDRTSNLAKRIPILKQDRPPAWRRNVIRLQAAIERSKEREALFDHCLDLARSVGDAFAWVLLRGDERMIHPLTQNAPVPTPIDNLVLKATLDLAASLWVAGAGFPIIHDMTHRLRIGDVTFVQRHESPLTVELKSSIIQQNPDRTYLQMGVHAIGTPADRARWDTINSRIQRAVVGDGPPMKTPRTPNSRMSRQLSRMMRAVAWMNAEPNQPISSDGVTGYLLKLPEMQSMHHWGRVQELADSAMKHGYASAILDGAMLYVAIYNEDGFLFSEDQTLLNSFLDRLQEDLVSSGILFNDPARNLLQVWHYADHCAGNSPPQTYPSLLHELSLETRINLLSGKLLIVVLANLGRFLVALQDAGIDARFPNADEAATRSFLIVSKSIVIGEYANISVDAGDLGAYMAKVAYEFLSLDAFVAIADSIINNLTDVAAKQVAAELQRSTLSETDSNSYPDDDSA